MVLSYEHYIINDNSTDNSLTVIKDTIDSLSPSIRDKFKLINNSENMGAVYNTINTIRAVSDADICTALRLAMSAVLLLPASAETDLPRSCWASPGCPSVLLPVRWSLRTGSMTMGCLEHAYGTHTVYLHAPPPLRLPSVRPRQAKCLNV